MPNLGAPEIIILILVIVVLFGWKKLPDAARSLGRSMRIFKAEVEEMKDKPSAASRDTVAGETRRDDGRRDDVRRETLRPEDHRDDAHSAGRDSHRDADGIRREAPARSESAWDDSSPRAADDSGYRPPTA